LGISIFAAAVDSQEHTQKVAESLGFPVAYGVTREQADLLDSWWDDRGFIQPSEFLILRGGEVRFSTYSNSPVGRMDAAEMLALMTMVIAGSKK
jgi:hypothetical protein